MLDIKIIIILLSYFISFSNCKDEILNYFNVTKIEPYENGCNKDYGKYYFKISCDIDKPFTGNYIVYTYLETPSGGKATCFYYENFGFICVVNLIDYPLTEKKILLSKKQPYSSYKYIFSNWEEFITEHKIFSETIDCPPTIRNTFIYSSVEKDENSFIIKGKWSKKSESLTPQFAAHFYLKLLSSVTSEVTCTYNLEKKTEYNCTYKGDDIPSFEDQIFSNSDNYVYKIEKKTSDDNTNGTSFIVFDLLLILLILL